MQEKRIRSVLFHGLICFLFLAVPVVVSIRPPHEPLFAVNSYVVRLTMKALMEKLNPNEFIRIHRSYIIPVAKIQMVKHKTLILKGGEGFPIGKNYEENVKIFFDTDI